MSKFKIEYYYINIREEEIEAKYDSEAIERFREEHEHEGIKSVKYVYEGDEEPKEWYCMWWNGNSWNHKIIIAHNRDEIYYNIKDTLDWNVYNFCCCINEPKAIEGLHRDTWD